MIREKRENNRLVESKKYIRGLSRCCRMFSMLLCCMHLPHSRGRSKGKSGRCLSRPCKSATFLSCPDLSLILRLDMIYISTLFRPLRDTQITIGKRCDVCAITAGITWTSAERRVRVGVDHHFTLTMLHESKFAKKMLNCRVLDIIVIEHYWLCICLVRCEAFIVSFVFIPSTSFIRHTAIHLST